LRHYCAAYVDAEYDNIDNRNLCLAKIILPLIRDRGEPHGSGLGIVRYMVEQTSA